MQIQWFGLNTVRIQDNNISLLVTSPEAEEQLNLPRMQNEVLVYTAKPAKLPKKDNTFVVADPGEYELKDFFIYAMAAEPDQASDKMIFLFEHEGMSVAHLGELKNTKLTEDQLERLEDVDILLIPVGGGAGLNAKQAVELINQLEPRVVVPLNYALPGVKVKLDALEVFKKELGDKFETVDKLKINKKDLPEEDTRYIIIEQFK